MADKLDQKIEAKQKQVAQLVADLNPMPADPRQILSLLWQDRVNAAITRVRAIVTGLVHKEDPKDKDECGKKYIEKLNEAIEGLTAEKQRMEARIVTARQVPKSIIEMPTSGRVQ